MARRRISLAGVNRIANRYFIVKAACRNPTIPRTEQAGRAGPPAPKAFGASTSSGNGRTRVLNNHRSKSLFGFRDFESSRSQPGDGARQNLIQSFFQPIAHAFAVQRFRFRLRVFSFHHRSRTLRLVRACAAAGPLPQMGRRQPVRHCSPVRHACGRCACATGETGW